MLHIRQVFAWIIHFREFFEIKDKYVNDSSSNENAQRCSKIEFLNYFHRHWPYLPFVIPFPCSRLEAESSGRSGHWLIWWGIHRFYVLRPLILFLSMFCSMPFRYLQSLCVSVGTHAKSGSFHTWIWIFRRSWIFIKLIYRQSPFFPSADFFNHRMKAAASSSAGVKAVSSNPCRSSSRRGLIGAETNWNRLSRSPAHSHLNEA